MRLLTPLIAEAIGAERPPTCVQVLSALQRGALRGGGDGFELRDIANNT